MQHHDQHQQKAPSQSANDPNVQTAMSRAASSSSLPALGLSDGEGSETAASALRKASATGPGNGARTLMSFRGCTQRMDCTILLKVGCHPCPGMLRVSKGLARSPS